MSENGQTAVDGLREVIAKALPHTLQPVGAQLKWRDSDELTGYGEFLVDALLKAVQQAVLDARAAELESAREYAREATRMGFAEERGPEFTRHWAGVAGWLRRRRETVLGGGEPNWPDAADCTAALTDGTPR